MLSFIKAVFKRTLIFLLCLFLFVITGTMPALAGGEIGVVNVDKLNFRPEPGTNSPPLMTLEKGDKIIVLELKDKWLKGVCRGEIGYIRNRKGYITIPNQNGFSNKSEEEDTGPLGTMMAEADTIDQKIDEREANVLTLTEKEETIINGLNEIDLVLNTVRKKASALRVMVDVLKEKVDATTDHINHIKKKMGEYRKYVDHRLVALYKLNKAGGMSQILTSADSMHDLLKRKAIFQRILEHDEKMLMTYAEDMARLNELLKMQKSQKKEQALLMADLNDQTRIIAAEKDKRKKLLKHIRNEKRLELAVIESLRQAQQSLDEKIELYNSRIENLEIVEKTPSSSFGGLKGLLNLPVRGRIVSFFGPYTNRQYNVVNFRSGIDIQTERGEPIRAVCSGKVLFADWFKGYGNMLIIDHGDHYYTVYANIEEMFKPMGSSVKTGEVIATAGDSGSLTGPKLYFEIRYHGEPLDPVKWVKKG